jgi:hypothetical protein
MLSEILGLDAPIRAMIDTRPAMRVDELLHALTWRITPEQVGIGDHPTGRFKDRSSHLAVRPGS